MSLDSAKRRVMEVLTCLTLINLILCIATGSIGIAAWIELKSFMKSTHKVEFLPFDPKEEVALKKEPLRDDDLNEFGI